MNKYINTRNSTTRRSERRKYFCLNIRSDESAPAPTSRRLNVVVRSPAPLSERWAEMVRQLPREVRPSGRPQSSGNIFRLAVYWPVAIGRQLFLSLRPDPNTYHHSLVLLLLLASGNVYPNPGPAPVCPTNPIYPCSAFAPEKLGKPQSNAADARCGSTPPASGSLGSLSGPCFPGVTWVVGSVHPVQQTYPTKLKPLWWTTPPLWQPLYHPWYLFPPLWYRPLWLPLPLWHPNLPLWHLNLFLTLNFSDPASDYLRVKVNFQKRSHLLFFNVYSLRSETLSSILDLAPSPLNFSRTPVTPLFSR